MLWSASDLQITKVARDKKSVENLAHNQQRYKKDIIDVKTESIDGGSGWEWPA